MIALFCDLDGTLIYSHRNKPESAEIVAEIFNGNEQSYITKKTFDFLSSEGSFCFIPVTMRTMSQYQRLEKTLGFFHCEYSVILNGAILIKNGFIDNEWLEESKNTVMNSSFEMHKAGEVLKKLGNTELLYIDDFLTYISSGQPEYVAKKAMQILDSSHINISYDSRKVYCMPSSINKGTAVNKLIKIIKPELTFGSGDSINDLSLLQAVDIPVIPESLEKYVSNQRKIVVPVSELLSDALCDAILNCSKTS